MLFAPFWALLASSLVLKHFRKILVDLFFRYPGEVLVGTLVI